MDTTAAWRVLRRSWPFVVACVLLGAGAAAAVTLVRAPDYKAVTEVYVGVPGASTTSDLAQGGSAAEQKIQSFVAIVQTATVLDPVVDELGLEGGTAALADRVSASSPVDSVLIDIAVTAPAPDLAASTADAVARSLARAVEDDLERPEEGSSRFTVTIVQPAEVPMSPLGLPLWASTLSGGLAGGALGAALAALRRLLDRRLHERAEVEEILSSPVLGAISFDRDTPRHPLVVQQPSSTPRAEDLRRLRTNLQFLGTSSAAYTVTSAVQGEGKTTTTANLAVALSELGLRVALVDADLHRPAVAGVMGIEGEYGLTDLLIGRGELETALQPWGTQGLHVLPAGATPPNPTELLASPAMELVLSELGSRFDVVLLDAPPLLPVSDALVLSSLTRGSLLAVALHQTTRQQVEAARTILHDGAVALRGVVLTKVRRQHDDAYTATYESSYSTA